MTIRAGKSWSTTSLEPVGKNRIAYKHQDHGSWSDGTPNDGTPLIGYSAETGPNSANPRSPSEPWNKVDSNKLRSAGIGLVVTENHLSKHSLLFLLFLSGWAPPTTHLHRPWLLSQAAPRCGWCASNPGSKPSEWTTNSLSGTILWTREGAMRSINVDSMLILCFKILLEGVTRKRWFNWSKMPITFVILVHFLSFKYHW